MKYYAVDFRLSPSNDNSRSLLASCAGDIGFEAFEDTANGVTGYIQQSYYDVGALREMVENFPFPDIKVTYTTKEAEDKDWNEEWEREGFAPVMIDGVCCIHDGRHLPMAMPTMAIEIDAKMAFGTGTHETTRMMVKSILALRPEGQRVLDCGCGTGILAITALKAGACKAFGYDIDEWSVDNARHNAIINQVGSRLTTVHGDATAISSKEGAFNLVVANINRNILLEDLQTFRGAMAPGGHLLMSGFYTEDAALLTGKAAALGLRHIGTLTDNGWASLHFSL